MSSKEDPSTESVIHPTTQQEITMDEFKREANEKGYEDWIEYLEFLDSQMEIEGEDEEEEEEETTAEDQEKKERIEKMRETDALECTLSLTYSRECHICHSSNPLYRAVFTKCGHWSCLPCGETLSREGTLTCPFCRETTPFVKMYERTTQPPDNPSKEDTIH